MTRPVPLSAYLAGRISPYVALAQLALSGHRTPEIEALLRPLHGPLVSEIRKILSDRRAAIDDMANGLTEAVDCKSVSMAPCAAISAISADFDRLVRKNAESSVASYSLGDPVILTAATQEIVSWLHAKNLLHENSAILDLGCGFGRVAAALAVEGHRVLGLDVSPQMIHEARRRYGDLPGLTFMLADGLGIDFLVDSRFDLALAVDSFPYMVLAGPEVVERHFMGVRRCLQPGGVFVILNFSYRGDLMADQQDADLLAKANKFRLTACGETPFVLWDGAAFIFHI